MDVIRAERVELLDGMRAILRRGDVVVTRQQEGGDLRAREAHDALAPFALECRGWRTIAVGVASENHEVDFFVDGGFHDEIQGFQEIHHTLRQPTRGIVLPIISHVDMRVSKVEEFDHGLIIMDWLARQAGFGGLGVNSCQFKERDLLN